LELIKVENYIANLSVIVPKKILHSLGGYDDHPVIKRVCDWDLWIRIGTFYPVKRVRKLIGHVFCQTPNSIESTVCYDRKAIDAYLSTDRELPMIVSLDEPLPELEPLPAHLNSLYPQLRKQISQLPRPKSLPDHPKGKLYMPSRLVMTDFAYRGYLVNFSFRCPTDRLIAIKLFGSTRGQQIKNPAEYRIKVDQQIVAEGILESMINHSWWEIPLENQLTQVKDSLIEITLIHRDKAPFNLLLTESEDAPAIENFTIKPADAFRWPIFYLRMVRSYIKSYIKRKFKKPGRIIRSGQSPALRILG
ncbi:MAG: hypothetical protein KDK40_04930, partial [Chlamydiia bacterium]|nr:hypothetical protein [Chlamydiia bacterium]